MNKNHLLQKYLFSDILASLIVWMLFVLFRKAMSDISFLDGMRYAISNNNYFISLLLFPFCCLFVHYLSGFYLNLLKKSRISVVFSTFISSAIISVSVFFIIMLGDVIVSYKYFYFSMLVLFGLLFVVTYFFRAIIFSHLQHNYQTKKWTINTLIIGTGDKAKIIAENLEKHSPRNTLVGFVSINKQLSVPANKIVGNVSKIASIIQKYDISETIVALENNTTEHQLFAVIKLLYTFNVDIQFTPRLYEILTGSAKISQIGKIPLVSITRSSMSDCEASIKRFFDILVSLLAFILLSPVLLYFMIQIKRDSTGAIFYRQERIGRLGKPFNILKFRTMHLGSENGKPQLSSANDTRVTPIGRILRKYRIDEIPQFWNILKGEMSLVGPRPERQYYINQIIEEAPYYCLLYKIRPGLTSWGPIKIGYSDTIEKMIERLNYDLIYLENMSLREDLKILIYTLEIIFKGKGV